MGLRVSVYWPAFLGGMKEWNKCERCIIGVSQDVSQKGRLALGMVP